MIDQKTNWQNERLYVQNMQLSADDIVKIDVSGEQCHYERKLLSAVPNSLLFYYFNEENIHKFKDSDRDIQQLILSKQNNKLILLRNPVPFRLMMNYINQMTLLKSDSNDPDLMSYFSKDEKNQLMYELKFWKIRIDENGNLVGTLE